MHPRLLALAALALAGCSFPSAPRDGVAYACVSDDECPAPMRCNQGEQLCVPPLTVGDVTVASASLDYEPRPDNPHQAVSSARLDTRLRVTVTLDQPVTCVRLRAEPDEVGFGLDDARAATCTFSGTPRRAGVETSVALTLELIDTLGITRSVAVSLAEPPRVDTLAPRPADVDQPGLVTFVRAPYGSLQTMMLARDRVTGGAGSVEPGSRVQLIASSGSSVLATVDASSTGAFGPAEFTADPERVGVLVIDRAGNGSGVVEVRDVSWVVNHGGPATNPHRAATRRSNDDLEAPLTEESPAFADEVAALARDDAQRLTVTGGVGVWQEVVSVGGDGALAWDSKRWRVISVTAQATAVWDGTTWERVAAGLTGVVLAAYEPRQDRFVALNTRFETYQRRPGDAQWTLIAGARVSRSGALLTASPADGALYLVGGDQGEGLPTRTLRLDGSAWVEVGAPFPALQVRGAWDATGALVAYGSPLEPGAASPTTVSLAADGGVSSQVALPPERREPCVAWVPGRARVVLAGGVSPNGGELSDVWEWDGRVWSEVTPPQRAHLGGAVRCVYDERQRGIVTVSSSGTRLLGDDNGTVSVRLLAGAGAPPPSGSVVGAWGGSRGVVTTGTTTAQFDGTGWATLPFSTPAFTQVATDDEGGFFGARAGDGGVELFALSDAGWQRAAAVVPATSPFILYHQPDAGLVVESSQGAWLARTAQPLARPVAGNTVRGFERAGFSPALDCMVRVTFMQTFGLGAQGWSILDSQLDPIAVASQPQVVPGAGTFLFRDGRVLRLASGATPLWSEVSTTRGDFGGGAVQPYRFVAGFNAESRRLWVYDGAQRRTWQLRLEAQRPALLSRFVLPAVERAQLTSLSLRASALGTGGVRARVFADGAWVDPSGLATNLEARDTSRPVELTVDEPRQLAQLTRGEQLVTALEPADDNGAGAASVSVDYVELEVRYRLPGSQP